MKTKSILATLAVVALLAAGPAAAASDLWLHVKIRESSGSNEAVTVNLPISVVEKALPLIPQDAMRQGHIVIDDAEFDAERLRELWQEVKDTPDMTFVTVDSDKESVKVYKEGRYLRVSTTEARDGGAEVNARVPLTVVDALLSGEGNTLNLQAAIQALAAHGEGELVTVREGDSSVRVWIDQVPEAAE